MDLTKPVLIDAEGEWFAVFFQNAGRPDYNMQWKGKMVAIFMASDGTYTFMSDTSSDSTDDVEKARVWFEFSYCWRGVWEGRIYFKQEEFWSEDILVAAQAWKQIEKILKERIKQDNPDYGYFDD